MQHSPLLCYSIGHLFGVLRAELVGATHTRPPAAAEGSQTAQTKLFDVCGTFTGNNVVDLIQSCNDHQLDQTSFVREGIYKNCERPGVLTKSRSGLYAKQTLRRARCLAFVSTKRLLLTCIKSPAFVAEPRWSEATPSPVEMLQGQERSPLGRKPRLCKQVRLEIAK